MSSSRRFGRYQLIGTLANGSMARLYLAFITGADGFRRTVVLKRIAPYHSTLPEFVQMFLSEARLATRLDHPNIVRTFEFGEVDGQHYISMEYVPGEDLARILALSQKVKKNVPIKVAASIAQSTADALHFAHTLTSATGTPLGLVHRDVSLSNILVSHHGVAKLADFGIAKLTTVTSNSSTRLGTFKGKYAYASPEHLRGETLDGRSDVFSLGVVLWEMLAVRRLFRRPNEAATIHAVHQAEIPPPSRLSPDVPRSLDAIVLKALARDREDRFASAAELSEALETILTGVSAKSSASHIKAWANDLIGRERASMKLAIAQGVGFEEDPENPGELILPAERAAELGISPPFPPDVAMPAPRESAAESFDASAGNEAPTHVPEPTKVVAPARADVPPPENLLHHGAWSTEVPANRPTREEETQLEPVAPLPEPPPAPFPGWATAMVVSAIFTAAAVVFFGYDSGTAPGVVELSVSSNPSGAAISVNGIPTALVTPAKIPRLDQASSVTVMVEKEGFDPGEKLVTLAGPRNQISFDLQRLTSLEIDGGTVPYGRVIVDGKAFQAGEAITVRAGEHQVKLERDGEVVFSKNVEVSGERFVLRTDASP